MYYSTIDWSERSDFNQFSLCFFYRKLSDTRCINVIAWGKRLSCLHELFISTWRFFFLIRMVIFISYLNTLKNYKQTGKQFFSDYCIYIVSITDCWLCTIWCYSKHVFHMPLCTNPFLKATNKHKYRRPTSAGPLTITYSTSAKMKCSENLRHQI